MAYLTLDFLNKNMYRKYPIRATSSHVFTDGIQLPQALITSLQITTVYGKHALYVHKIYAKDGYVSVLVRDYNSDEVLGSFSGIVTKNQQTINFTAIVSNISGSITIGNISAINALNGAHYLTPDDGRIEDSTIFCFIPPSLTSISCKNDKASGILKLIGGNITFEETDDTIGLTVVNRNLILSKNDTSGSTDNCGTPIITHINTVPPSSIGNIDVFGIDPIQISVEAGKINITAPDLTIPIVCPEKNKLAPPYSTDETYYTDISVTHTPEWKTWPQFSP